MQTEVEAETAGARRWFGLSVASLGIAGGLSLVLVITQVTRLMLKQGFDVDFVRRALVVHVDHAVGVWFFSFIAGLFCLLPGPRPGPRALFSVATATLGTLLFTAFAFGNDAPLLTDYVPVLDDASGLFFVGLGGFALGVVATFIDVRRLVGDSGPSWLEAPARDAVRASAVAFLLALLTLVGALVTEPGGLAPFDRYQRLFWGAGHVFQVSCVLAMLASWDVLLRQATGVGATGRGLALTMVGLLLVPPLIAPALTFTQQSGAIFTRFMQWGIFPMVSVVLLATVAALFRHRAAHAGKRMTPAFTALVTSLAMTVVGFCFGAMISGAKTMVPAHYHLAMGAVTVAFMGALLTLMPRLGWPVVMPRAAAWQPLFYGVGQSIFAVGLAVADLWGGAARKEMGQEAIVEDFGKRLGRGIQGLGGLIAMVGGVLFVLLVIRAVLAARRARVAG